VPRLLTLTTLLFFASCATPPGRHTLALVDSGAPRALAEQPQQPAPPRPMAPVPVMPQNPTRIPQQAPPALWRPHQPLMQGFFGVTEFQKVSVDLPGSGHIDGDKGDLDQLPLLGGGAQWKLGGDRIDWGLEGMMSFAWRSDATAFVVGGGGAAVAVDTDLVIFELFGGPFASTFLGDKTRVYGGAGPLMQWASFDQDVGDGGSGFGTGLYARTGIEFMLQQRTLLGFGVRWSDSTVDLGGNLGDLEIDGLQMVLTVSRL